MTPELAGIARACGLLLAGVLTWAAIAKLRRPGRAGAGFRALGLPAPEALAVAVPLAELATALLLITAPALGGLAAVALLGVFTVFLAGRVRGGAQVSCGCFGSARAEPLTWAALVRNGLLIALALPGLALDAPGVPPLEAVLAASVAVAIAAVVVALADLKARTGRLWDNRLTTEGGGP